jgi:hypothetical protein
MRLQKQRSYPAALTWRLDNDSNIAHQRCTARPTVYHFKRAIDHAPRARIWLAYMYSAK